MTMNKLKFSFIVLIVCICSAHCAKNASKRLHPMHSAKPNASYLPVLETYLYHGPGGDDDYYYDYTVRPNLYSTLNIYTHFYLLGVGLVDEKKGSISTTGILMMEWIDSRLMWNPADFGNISTAIFDGYKIWTPKFLHNGVSFLPRRYSVLSAQVHHDGGVVVSLSVNEETPCRFDMTEFPRDTQQCYIHLIHPDLLVRLYASGSGNIGKIARENNMSIFHHSAWEIQNVTMTTSRESIANSGLNFLTIAITMKRHATFFLRIYVAPVCFLLLLIPIIFLLPPDSTEKLTFGAILLFCMIYVSQTVEAIYPPYTDAMPYLIQLTTASGALLFICILLTSLISSVERIGRKKALPPWMKRYIVGVIGPYLLVKENDDGLTRGTVHIKPADGNDQTFIIQSEQTVDLSENHNAAASTTAASVETNDKSDVNQSLQSLVNELKYSRLQGRAYDDWTNLFTIINRLLFLITLIIGIIIILCFA